MKVMKWVLKIIVSILLLASLFVGILTIFEYRPKDAEGVTIQNNGEIRVNFGEDITIMTFNIGYAGLGKDEDFVMDGGTKGRPDSKDVVQMYLDGIKSIIEDHPSDIYLLQEVDLNSRRSYRINQFDAIGEQIGGGYNQQFAYNFKALFVPFPLSLTDYIGYVESGIATYSRFHTSEAMRYQFPGSFSWPLRVANLKRAMMVSTYPIEGSTKVLQVVNLHMSAYDGDGSLRAQEMAFLKAFMEEQNRLGNYVIIGGDFNQTFPEAEGVYVVPDEYYVAYPIEESWLPIGYQYQIDVTTPSCRLLNQPYQPSDPKTQYYIIDGFIVSPNVEIVNVQGKDLKFENSDHNPVSAVFKLK